jgi:hypothetical protein
MEAPPETNTKTDPAVSLAPALMMAFWALLGSAAGVKTAQGLWHLLGWGGDLAVAVPVGAVAGAVVGALLGLITRPHLLVLLMAVFAGASAGGVAGQLIWGELGQFGGQAVGGLIGAAAWAAWLFLAQARDRPLGSPAGRNAGSDRQAVAGKSSHG